MDGSGRVAPEPPGPGGAREPGDREPEARHPAVVLVLATSTGGVGVHVRALAAGLATAGTLVTVCGPAATGERFDFTATGARFVPVEISPAGGVGDAAAVRALRRVLRAETGAVVHAHGLRAGIVAALARRGASGRGGRPPLVVTLHNAVLAGGWRGRASAVVERVVARAADVVLGASPDLVARSAALGASDARLAPVAAPPLPAPARPAAAVRAELGAGPATPLLLSVGRLHPQKGYDVLVAAAAQWRDWEPPPLVAVAGTGPCHLELTGRIAESGAPVRLLGHRTDVPDLLAAADAALVTSVWEARQLFAQEALAAGVPLVATAVGGLTALVGDAAVLVPPGDVDALDRAVRELVAALADPDRRAAWAARARARAATWPTQDQTLAQVRGVYAELATGDG